MTQHWPPPDLGEAYKWARKKKFATSQIWPPSPRNPTGRITEGWYLIEGNTLIIDQCLRRALVLDGKRVTHKLSDSDDPWQVAQANQILLVEDDARNEFLPADPYAAKRPGLEILSQEARLFRGRGRRRYSPL